MVASSTHQSTRVREPAREDSVLLKKVEELQARLDKVDSKEKEGTKYKYSLPFTQEIMEEPLPLRWHTPNFDSYDGTTDPWEHLDNYRAKMGLQGATNAILCRGFPGTLKGGVSDWFRKFKKGDIDSFVHLTDAFLGKFGM